MYEQFSNRFGRKMISIHPGEFYVTAGNEIISTVLGSCVAVAMFDRAKRVGGLNHFMLPASFDQSHMYTSNSGKYGMYAMELLINGLLKAGANRANLRAKVFGGGSVLRVRPGNNGRTIPQSNIEFAMAFLRTEGIPVESSDTGGVNGRKILYFAQDHSVKLKRLGSRGITEVTREEEEYLATLQTRRPKSSEVELL